MHSMKKSKLFFVLALSVFTKCFSQLSDTNKTVNLNEVIISGNNTIGNINRMPDISENTIYAAKKSEVINLKEINADLSTNNTRQVFGRIPGMTIWENEGSGIQVGVAARGLSPNRSWEFNVKQNGYDISPDAFGYPEAYYNPPMEAVDKIQVVRGASSLQFGPQFGGLLNYELKKGNPLKPITFETQQTIGSYGLFNTYNAIGGKHKKLSYYAFFHDRSANGWRNNSDYTVHTGYLSLNYQLTKKINVALDYTNSDYTSQQPGGLTDLQFKENTRQSFRERNWFGAPWNVASLTFKYDITNSLSMQVKSFAIHAERNSVGITSAITIKDTIIPATLQFKTRQADRDYYNFYGSEARASYKYIIGGKENVLAAGLRVYGGETRRNQIGSGTSGSDFDLNLTQPNYGRSLNFGTGNFAAFVENIFTIGKKIKVVPGLRYEYIKSEIDGYFNSTNAGVLKPEKRIRQFLLYGIGSEFALTNKTTIYSNYSLGYRPTTYSELTPSATSEIIDPNLKDAQGYNADLGYRGTVKNYLSFDVSAFYLHYGNRVGTISQDGNLYRTNIGTSVSKGLESYIAVDVVKIFNQEPKAGTVSVFASNSFIEAKYVKWNNPAIASDPAKSIENKRVENAPKFIHRFGISYYLKGLSATVQVNQVSDVYTDAVNTETPNAAGTVGKLAAYRLLDASLTYNFSKKYNLKAGVNNLDNTTYATRRAGGYPGPGILPGNGRTFFVSFGATL